MKKSSLVKISIGLIIVSVIIYALQILIFNDPNTTAFYIFQDMAFMPVTIAVATFVVGYIIDERDRKERLEKTRMLTSSFFTDIGTELLWKLINSTNNSEYLIKLMESRNNDFGSSFVSMNMKVKLSNELADEIKKLLDDHWMIMMVIASNPILLEHEQFTDMLWAVFHLRDELKLRGRGVISEENMKHIEGDTQRVFELLLSAWISHAEYVKKEYPYFYASSARELYNRLKMAYKD